MAASSAFLRLASDRDWRARRRIASCPALAFRTPVRFWFFAQDLLAPAARFNFRRFRGLWKAVPVGEGFLFLSALPQLLRVQFSEGFFPSFTRFRSEEHTSELQSPYVI